MTFLVPFVLYFVAPWLIVNGIAVCLLMIAANNREAAARRNRRY